MDGDERKRKRIQALRDLIEDELDSRISDRKAAQLGNLPQASFDARERERAANIAQYEQEIAELK